MQTTTIKATDENFACVNEFIHGFIPQDCDFKTLNQIDLAVEEIYINISHYAYSGAIGDVEISCGIENDMLTIIFKDSGKHFDPLARPDPDITLSAEERDIGGLGIYLTKKFMDKVDYEYNGEMNIMKIQKRIR